MKGLALRNWYGVLLRLRAMQLKSIIVRGQFSYDEAVEGTFMTILTQARSLRLESNSLNLVEVEPIPPTLDTYDITAMTI